MSWIRRQCETVNTDYVLESEVCKTPRAKTSQHAYYVEISLCIDCLHEMCNSFDASCENLLKMWTYIYSQAEKRGKTIKKLRLNIVLFGNRYLGSVLSSSFTIPNQIDSLCDFIKLYSFHKHMKYTEANWLTSLKHSMDIEWNVTNDYEAETDTNKHLRLQTIILSDKEYLSAQIDELSSIWHEGIMSKIVKRDCHSGRRLVLFAPDVYPWTEVGMNYCPCIHHPVKIANGLRDIDFETIISSCLCTI